MKPTSRPWYGKNNMSGQGLVYQEETGKNIAVAYDIKDTALIAAAPDLLEACKGLIDDWHSDDANYDVEEPKHLEMARQAIQKATE